MTHPLRQDRELVLRELAAQYGLDLHPLVLADRSRSLRIIAAEAGVTIPPLSSWSSAVALIETVGGTGEEVGEPLEVIDFNGNEEIIEASYPTIGEVNTYIDFEGCIALESASFPILETVGEYVTFEGCAALESIHFPRLAEIGERLEFEDSSGLTEISFPELVTIGGQLTVSGCTSVGTFSFPVLETLGGRLNLTQLAIVTLNLSTVTSIAGEVNIADCPNLVSIDLSGLETIAPAGGISISADSLTTIDFSSLLHVDGAVGIIGALTQGAVDAILIKLASLDGTGGTTSYDNQLVGLNFGTNSPPSASGLTAKATLEGRGCTVGVNS